MLSIDKLSKMTAEKSLLSVDIAALSSSLEIEFGLPHNTNRLGLT